METLLLSVTLHSERTGPYTSLITIHVVRNYLTEDGINAMVCLARNSHLNPIKHIWDILEKGLRDHPDHPNKLRVCGTSARNLV